MTYNIEELRKMGAEIRRDISGHVPTYNLYDRQGNVVATAKDMIFDINIAQLRSAIQNPEYTDEKITVDSTLERKGFHHSTNKMVYEFSVPGYYTQNDVVTAVHKSALAARDITGIYIETVVKGPDVILNEENGGSGGVKAYNVSSFSDPNGGIEKNAWRKAVLIFAEQLRKAVFSDCGFVEFVSAKGPKVYYFNDDDSLNFGLVDIEMRTREDTSRLGIAIK